MHRTPLPLILVLLFALPSFAQKPIPISQLKRTDEVSFGKEILPLFRKSCLACHSDSEANGELVLETPAALIKGGDSGPAVVAGKGNESLLLKMASHQLKPLMPPPDNEVAASPLTSQELGLIKLWIDQGAKGSAAETLLSPQIWRQLPPGKHPIYAVAVSPDGQFAACGRANQIFIYHVPTGQLIARLSDPNLQQRPEDNLPGISHLDVVQSLRFNRQGDRLASGGFRTVKLWQYPRDVQTAQLSAPSAVTAIVVSAQRQVAIIAGADNLLQLWNMADQKVVAVLDGHTAPVTALCLSADETLLYSASQDQTIRIWDLAKGSLLQVIQTPTPIEALTLLRQQPTEQEVQAADGGPAPVTRQFLVTGGSDNLIRSWKIPTAYRQTLLEIPAAPTRMAIDPQSRLLAIATSSGQIQIRQDLAGKPLRSWQAHKGALTALHFITAVPVEGQPANERRIHLVTSGPERSLRIWNVTDGQLVREVHHSLATVSHLGSNATGTRLVSATETGSVTVWNLEVKPAVAPVVSGNQSAGPLAVSSDRTLLALVANKSERPAVVVINAQSGETLQVLLGHDGPILDLVFSSDNSRLATASADGTARIWLLADGKFPEVARLSGHQGPVTATGFSADGKQLITGGADKIVKTWSLETGQEVATYTGHTGAIVGVGLAANNQPLSLAADKTLKQWNPANGQPVRTIQLAAIPVSSTLANDRALISVALDDHSLAIYQLSDGKLLQTLVGHSSPLKSHLFNSDRSQLISTSADHQALLWRISDGRLLQAFPVDDLVGATFTKVAGQLQLLVDGQLLTRTVRFQAAGPAHDQPVRGLAVNPTGTQVYSAYADGVIRGFAIDTGAQLYNTSHGGPLQAMAMRPNGQLLVTAGADKLLKIWNPANGASLAPNQIAGIDATVAELVFSHDGLMLLARDDVPAGGLKVINIANGAVEQVMAGFKTAAGSLLAVGQNDQRMIAGVTGTTVHAWPLLSHRTIAGHTKPVTSLAPLAGTFFISGSLDGTVRHWNLVAANPVVRQMNHGAAVLTVAVSPDGQRIASGSENASVRLWNVANGAQVAEMKGDIRAKVAVVKSTDQLTNTTVQLTAAKSALDAAQKLLPMKTTAEATAKQALTAATADSTAKAETLGKATATKSAAEKLAIDAAAKAQLAATASEVANQAALESVATAKIAADTSIRLVAATAAQPGNQALAARSAAAQKASADLASKSQAATAAKAVPTKTAADSATAAAAAAAKALTTGKPYTDAAAAFTTSQQAQQVATVVHALANKELAAATQAIPTAKQEIAALEASVTRLTASLEAATKAAADALKPIRSLAFSPDGSQLASGGDMNVVHTWDGTSGKNIASYVGHAGIIQALAFLDDQSILSGSADKSAIQWNLKPNWKLERVIGSPDDPATLIDRVVSVDFSLDGQLLATGGGVPSRNGELKIWKVADGSPVLSLANAHSDAVNSVAISPDGTTVASASADKYVRLFDITSGEQLAQCEGHTNHVLGVSWRGDGRLLASSGADNTIRIWNPLTGERVRSIAGFNKQVTALRFLGQTPNTIACSGDKIVRINNSENGGTIRNFAGAVDYLYAVDGSPNGQVIVAAGHAGVLRIWNGTNAQSLQVIDAPQPPAKEAAEEPGQDGVTGK